MRLLPAASLARPLVARIAPRTHFLPSKLLAAHLSTTPPLSKSKADYATPVSAATFWQIMDEQAREAHDARHPKRRPKADQWLRPEEQRSAWENGNKREGGNQREGNQREGNKRDGGRGGARANNRNRGGGQRGGQTQKGRKSKREKGINEGSSDEVLKYDIEALVGRLQRGEVEGITAQEEVVVVEAVKTTEAVAAVEGEAAKSTEAVEAVKTTDVVEEEAAKTTEAVEAAEKKSTEAVGTEAVEVTTTTEDIETEAAKSTETAKEAAEESDKPKFPPQNTLIDVKILELSSAGDGLGVHAGSPPHHIYVVPFSVPGDVVRARAWEHHPDEFHSHADFVSVVSPSPLRDDSRIKCRYFSKCSGCQFQMLDYSEQLRAKRTVVERAFARFSKLDPTQLPTVGDTIGSPAQYGYRTKLTPHFHGPPGHPGPRADGREPPFVECPDIGFMLKGRRKIVDIEDCAIGTDAVRAGLASERERMQIEYAKYRRGATILLRENTARYSPKESAPESDPSGAVRVEAEDHIDVKTVMTDHKAVATEYIGKHVFSNTAGSFFQNNNLIMPAFTEYIRSHILPPSQTDVPVKYLIDAYSGAGLFTITLSSLFESSTGIDIDASSITNASRNALANGIPPSRATFIAADATSLFVNVTYPADETVVVLDPPRRGCDADFLAQLLRFAPRRVVYVSCNVHTQARDVGVLVRGEGGARYVVESVRGFDFFPQTHHVEGVCVLSRVDEKDVDMAE